MAATSRTQACLARLLACKIQASTTMLTATTATTGELLHHSFNKLPASPTSTTTPQHHLATMNGPYTMTATSFQLPHSITMSHTGKIKQCAQKRQSLFRPRAYLQSQFLMLGKKLMLPKTGLGTTQQQRVARPVCPTCTACFLGCK